MYSSLFAVDGYLLAAKYGKTVTAVVCNINIKNWYNVVKF